MTDVHTNAFTEATLCFPIRDDQVLLAEKQKKIGKGFLNGFGGVVEADDIDVFAANVREVKEETGIRVTIVKKVGEIAFHNPSNDSKLKRMAVHIFIASEWDGVPSDTDEMKKISWYNISDLDYDRFLAADRLFLPQILSGKCIKGVIQYKSDWSVKSSKIDEVESF